MSLTGSDKRNAVQLTQHFSVSEGECHGENCCGGAVIIQPVLWRALQALRYRLGKPLSPTCVYRCPAHNLAVGGVIGSDHTLGMAADLPCPDEMDPQDFARHCLRSGFVRCGYYPTRRFVHASIKARDGYSDLWNGEA